MATPAALTAEGSHGNDICFAVSDLVVGYGSFVLMRDVNFNVRTGDIFLIMGGSGCGKSTLLRVLMGLKAPHEGQVMHHGVDMWSRDGSALRQKMAHRTGVLFQQGALWSSMTLAENVALPLEQYTNLDPEAIREQASLKLALTGLSGFEDYYPSEISGGMRKRAGLARALALDPEILFLDEPSAGLDPVTSRLLDDLILELRASLGTTFVIVSHELASIFAIASNGIFLDVKTRTATAHGNPAELVKDPATELNALQFLTRGDAESVSKEAKPAGR
jgi:phospholipid/cholesterol/gamma-HCH transport system ATP-binding protein